ncbi:MAG: fumarylacetoacetate hydrolase family protein [Dehalococcoidia bacterium]
MAQLDVPALAREMLDALDGAALVTPPSQRWPDLDFPTAYEVAREATRLRQARGEQPAGRKIGYTNRRIWPQYNVHQPIWDHVYAHTLHHARDGSATLSLSRMVAPRIEPEIAFKLRAPPPTGCQDPALVLESIEWVARTFEIVDCHYADWQFAGPDSVIDFSHHAALVVGEPLAVTPDDIQSLVDALRDCRVTLAKDGEVVDTGTGANALGHPALALAHLAEVLASPLAAPQPEAPPLGAGEVITTGTLTAALPVAPGETWRTDTEGLDLPPLTVRFE